MSVLVGPFLLVASPLVGRGPALTLGRADVVAVVAVVSAGALALGGASGVRHVGREHGPNRLAGHLLGLVEYAEGAGPSLAFPVAADSCAVAVPVA